MNFNLIQKPASKLLIAIFNPFNISQLYFAHLDYRFSSVMTNEKHLMNLSANNIAMMLVFTVILFFLSSLVLELKPKEIQSQSI